MATRKSSSEKYRYVVFCTACGQTAPLADEYDEDGHIKFAWHQPCPNCGKEEWATRSLNAPYNIPPFKT